MGLEIRAVGFADPDTQRLVAEVQAEYVARYGSPDEAPLETGHFDPPLGAFFLGYEDGVPVAMGGWRTRLDVRPFGGEIYHRRESRRSRTRSRYFRCRTRP